MKVKQSSSNRRSIIHKGNFYLFKGMKINKNDKNLGIKVSFLFLISLKYEKNNTNTKRKNKNTKHKDIIDSPSQKYNCILGSQYV